MKNGFENVKAELKDWLKGVKKKMRNNIVKIKSDMAIIRSL